MKSNHDREAQFARLLDEYSGMLGRIAATYGRTAEDQADILQEVRIQLWRALPTLDASRNRKTWAYRVALNSAISWFRKARRWQPVDFELETVLVGTGFSPETLVLRQLISELDPLDRALLSLHLDELSNEEVGDVLGISASNVAVKLTRLRQRLRTLANKEEL